MLTYDIANALFEYSEDTGEVKWRFDSPRFKRGGLVGTKTCTPKCHTEYLMVTLFWTPYKLHRIIWLMKTGSFPEKYIDHIDGNGLNNRWENLREATPSENMMNQRVRSDSTSGIKGVSFDKSRNKWYAYINVDGKRQMLGRHATMEEAAAARMKAEGVLHGEFAGGHS